MRPMPLGPDGRNELPRGGRDDQVRPCLKEGAASDDNGKGDEEKGDVVSFRACTLSLGLSRPTPTSGGQKLDPPRPSRPSRSRAGTASMSREEPGRDPLASGIAAAGLSGRCGGGWRPCGVIKAGGAG